MGGGSAVKTVNRQLKVDNEVVTKLIVIAKGSVERVKYP